MPALMDMVTRFWSGVEAREAEGRRWGSWTIRNKGRDQEVQTQSKNKCRHNADNDDDEVNAGFNNQCQSDSGKKKQFQGKTGNSGTSTYDKIMDRPCDIHAPKNPEDHPANQTNQNCWVHKKRTRKAGQGNADKPNPPNDDDEDGP